MDNKVISIGECIGKGSYGKVYKGIELEQGRPTCIKIVEIDKIKGMNDLLEPSILSTYEHPNLNHSIRICSDSYNLYIYQYMADSDLSFLNSRSMERETIKKICYGIIQGVFVLHSENIIHCDIKPNNILIYGDRPCITDFTLSVKKNMKDERFNHQISTVTYRAPEVILGKLWDQSSDIWSLGCTLYEFVTGKYLVEYQSKKNFNLSKRCIENKTFNAIIRWRKSMGDDNLSLGNYLIDDDVKDIELVQYSEDLNIDKELYDIILSMLRYHPEHRPTIFEIINNDYFSVFPIDSYKVNKCVKGFMSPSDRLIMTTHCEKYSDSKFLSEKACDIYSCCNKLDIKNKYFHMITCIYIASKIVFGFPVRINGFSSYILIENERLICEHMNFRLHTF